MKPASGRRTPKINLGNRTWNGDAGTFRGKILLDFEKGSLELKIEHMSEVCDMRRPIVAPLELGLGRVSRSLDSPEKDQLLAITPELLQLVEE